MIHDPIELAMIAGQTSCNYMSIYKNTNEDLIDIFNKYNVKDKDVLTVLSSSDQALTCYYKGAKTIDTFDRNYLTLYYYYLRKWLILYKKTLYPSDNFLNLCGNGDIQLYKLICSIIPRSNKENEAKIFWKKFMKFNEYKANFLFEDRYYTQSVPFENNLDDIKSFYNNEINFYNIDITKNINLPKQYDIVYLSNMLEYNEVTQKRNIVRINLESLLKENGIAICTYKITKKTDLWHKEEIKELTDGCLKLDSEYKHYQSLCKKKYIAYSYKKKKYY